MQSCFDAKNGYIVTIVTILAITAAWFDLRKNIIPNRLLFSGMGMGILLRTAEDILRKDSRDILSMAAEVAILFICLWPFYVMGGLGAGDCKLLLMTGVFLPVKQTVFVVTGTFFIAAAEIVLLTLLYKIKGEERKIKIVRLAPAFLIAVLAGWL